MKIINSLSDINLRNENFPIFFWDKWKTVEEKLHHKQRLLCADDEGNVVAFTIYKMKFFKKADYLYAPLDKNGERLAVEKEKTFLDEFHDFLKCERMVDVIFPPSHIVVFNAIPIKSLYYKIGLLVVDLTKLEDELLSAINKDNRKQIRKAESLNVSVYWNLSNLSPFYDCFQLSVRQKGFQNVSKEYFEKMISMLGNENIDIGIVVCNDKVDASIFCLKDNKHIYPLYSGTSFSPQYKGSNKYLFWQMYKKYKDEGLKDYISGGYRYGLSGNDPLHNVHLFKLGMGAEIEDGYHFIKIINPAKYAIVNAALKCKSLLTGRDCSFVNLKGLEVKKSE